MQPEKPPYLDNNATTPVDPQVLEAMLPFFKAEFGNASSNSHCYGWEAKMACDRARKQVAACIGADPKEIYFTSGATESNNWAVLGIVYQQIFAKKTPHIITSNIEHKAILDICEFVKKLGAEVTFLPVDPFGCVSATQVQEALQENTALVTIMTANNEIGSINPICKIAEVTKQAGAYFHTDAVQSIGKVDINVSDSPVDMLSLSAHKIYGPKGVGALYISKKPEVEIAPMMYGGAQEQGLRPGTLNVPGIVGLGKACELAKEHQATEMPRLQKLRDTIIDRLLSRPGVHLNGHRTERLCNNVSVSFENLTADLFALGLGRIALSSGSACTSASAQTSHVLRAIGLADPLARATLRIGLGRFTTEAEVDLVLSKIETMLDKN